METVILLKIQKKGKDHLKQTNYKLKKNREVWTWLFFFFKVWYKSHPKWGPDEPHDSGSLVEQKVWVIISTVLYVDYVDHDWPKFWGLQEEGNCGSLKACRCYMRKPWMGKSFRRTLITGTLKFVESVVVLMPSEILLLRLFNSDPWGLPPCMSWMFSCHNMPDLNEWITIMLSPQEVLGLRTWIYLWVEVYHHI